MRDSVTGARLTARSGNRNRAKIGSNRCNPGIAASVALLNDFRMHPDPEMLEYAARTIGSAEAMVITAGAGMGVDSGLPDFAGPRDLAGLSALCETGPIVRTAGDPWLVRARPGAGLGLLRTPLGAYRRTTPTKDLLAAPLGASKAHGHFVFTSNVDGQFQKAVLPRSA